MKGKRRGVAARALAVSLLAGAIAGCSYVPDWANPGEWFGDGAPPPPPRRSSGRPVAPPPQQAQPAPQGQAKPQAEAPSAEKPFPELGSTPERPQPQTTEAQRREIQQGLVADRENARYSEQVPIGAEGQGAPPPPPPSSSLAPAPRPQAARTAPQASPPASRQEANPPAPPQAASPQPAAPAAPAEPRAFDATGPVANGPRAFGGSALRAEEPRVFSPSRPAAEAPQPVPATAPPAPSGLTAAPSPPQPATRVAAAPPPPAIPSPPAAPASAPAGVAPAALPPPPSTPAAAAPRPPAAPVPQFNLPIAQDQQALAQAFAQGVAAQASPVTSVPPGTTFSAAGAPTPSQPQRSAALAPSAAPVAGPAATITFPHGGSALGGDDLAAIRQIAEAARGGGGAVRVVGHASQRTRNMSMERHRLANFNMSFERAQAVARALRQAGVDPRRLIVEAVGDSQPRYYEFMPNGEAENRRVEIFLE